MLSKDKRNKSNEIDDGWKESSNELFIFRDIWQFEDKFVKSGLICRICGKLMTKHDSATSYYDTKDGLVPDWKDDICQAKHLKQFGIPLNEMISTRQSSQSILLAKLE